MHSGAATGLTQSPSPLFQLFRQIDIGADGGDGFSEFGFFPGVEFGRQFFLDAVCADDDGDAEYDVVLAEFAVDVGGGGEDGFFVEYDAAQDFGGGLGDGGVGYAVLGWKTS